MFSFIWFNGISTLLVMSYLWFDIQFVSHDVFEFEVCNFEHYDFVRDDVFDLSYLNSEQLVPNMHGYDLRFLHPQTKSLVCPHDI